MSGASERANDDFMSFLGFCLHSSVIDMKIGRNGGAIWGGGDVRGYGHVYS